MLLRPGPGPRASGLIHIKIGSQAPEIAHVSSTSELFLIPELTAPRREQARPHASFSSCARVFASA